MKINYLNNLGRLGILAGVLLVTGSSSSLWAVAQIGYSCNSITDTEAQYSLSYNFSYGAACKGKNCAGGDIIGDGQSSYGCTYVLECDKKTNKWAPNSYQRFPFGDYYVCNAPTEIDCPPGANCPAGRKAKIPNPALARYTGPCGDSGPTNPGNEPLPAPGGTAPQNQQSALVNAEISKVFEAFRASTKSDDEAAGLLDEYVHKKNLGQVDAGAQYLEQLSIAASKTETKCEPESEIQPINGNAKLIEWGKGLVEVE